MPVIFTRIDDRLVHGQVVEGWIPFLDINEVVVVSAVAAKDDMRKTLMRLSLPEDVSLKVMDMEVAPDYLKKAHENPRRILVLAPSPREIAELLEKGVPFESVNVGGMHYSVGKIQIGRAIFLGDADVQSLKAITARGVRLEGRGVPTDKTLDIAHMLER